MQYFPTFEKTKRHQEIVTFACGLLSDTPLLVEHVYKLYIHEILYNDRFCTRGIFLDEELFRAVYRESRIKLSAHYLHNKFINIKDNSEYYHMLESKHVRKLYPGPLHRPSKVFLFSETNFDVLLGKVQRNEQMMDSAIIICGMEGENLSRLLSKCCEIGQDQPVAHLFLKDSAFPIFQDLSNLSISRNFLQLKMINVSMSSQATFNIIERISESTSTQRIDLAYTSLPGVKSFNLTNMNASLLYFSLHSVTMVQDLCKSLLRQTTFLTNLRSLKISLDKDYGFEVIDGKYCQISRENCRQIFRSFGSLQNLIHLEISRNNLRGCLFNFIPDEDLGLLSLESLTLRFTNLNSADLHHLTHLITTNKFPKLTHLVLRLHTFHDQMNILIKAAITHHPRRLNLFLTTFNVEHPWGFYEIENL